MNRMQGGFVGFPLILDNSPPRKISFRDWDLLRPVTRSLTESSSAFVPSLAAYGLACAIPQNPSFFKVLSLLFMLSFGTSDFWKVKVLSSRGGRAAPA